ncbi:MAG: MBL fold metallo-hydrolase [Phycisphaeraceae bacterium]|nr:MAG: MBL fold metallo-hydrolase [Phycisphaeraceae bacterium]
MFMRSIYDEGLAQAAYLIGCPKSGRAVLFDPLRDVDRYIALAAAHGLEISAVAETHIHADFVSGARELAERTGAHVYVSGEGGPDWRSRWLNGQPAGGYAHTELRDGDTFSIGGIEITAVHTPGHTPEHLIYLVTDRGGGATDPIGVITGDFLFVGDLGRPDLLETAAGQVGMMEPSARALYATIASLDAIPDYCQVWPGHGAGSACGKALGAVPMSTVGYERRFNPALKAATGEQAFVSFILDGQPEPPVYFADMKRVNRDGPAVLGSLPEPARQTPGELASVDARTTAIIDTRPWEQFRAGHIPGSLSLPPDKSFCSDAGSFVRADEPIRLIADPRDLEGLIRGLVRVGLDRIEGWCPSGEVTASSFATAKVEEVKVDRAGSLAPGEAVLDVRRRSEFDEGHIPGAANIAHTRLLVRGGEVPGVDRLLVCCRSGKRSARSCSHLKRLGHDVLNVEGGFLAWEASGAAIER